MPTAEITSARSTVEATPDTSGRGNAATIRVTIMASALTTAEVWELLQKRYSGDEWVILSEVRNAAGYDATRTADAIAMNMWPSRGLAMHGFEIKASRADWLRELKNPRKADAFMGRVDYWWLVVGDPAIVHDGELPDGWGLLAPRGGGLGVVTEPAKRPAVDISRPFLASLLRRAARELMPDARLAAVRREGFVEGRADGAASERACAVARDGGA